MKLIVTIPAYNEEETIADVIKSIPRKIKGIKKVEVLVWSDGSTDETVKLAKKAKADHVFQSKRNLGLARTFDLATTKAVELGADIIVNTDADNQYDQNEIPLLIKPILAGEADIVNGNRQVEKLEHMPTSKKYGNMLGSWVIRMLTGLTIQDASSGFRAYTAEAIKDLRILSDHTYTHETLVQTAHSNLTITEIPVVFKARHKKTGQSRLISNVFTHISKSAVTIIRTILMYKALRVMTMLGALELLLSVVIGARFLWFWLQGAGSGHIQSLILGSMLLTLGITTMMIGVLADLISINRRMISR